MNPTAGRDYPRSYAELRAWFDKGWKCLPAKTHIPPEA